MIFASTQELEVGKVYRCGNDDFIGITDHHGNEHSNVVVKIVRVATKQEYINYCIETAEDVKIKLYDGDHFYEIQTD